MHITSFATEHTDKMFWHGYTYRESWGLFAFRISTPRSRDKRCQALLSDWLRNSMHISIAIAKYFRITKNSTCIRSYVTAFFNFACLSVCLLLFACLSLSRIRITQNVLDWFFKGNFWRGEHWCKRILLFGLERIQIQMQVQEMYSFYGSNYFQRKERE